MKTGIKTIAVVLLLSVMSLASQGQKKNKGTMVVTTHLKETNGTYAQRQLYRSFLKDFMKDCPFISHFNVHEAIHSTDNHLVVWTYEVNGWKDITEFYNWINRSLTSDGHSGLIKALTPYKPDYNFGGTIHVEKISRSDLANRN